MLKNASTAAAAASLVVKAKPGALYHLNALSTLAGAQFVQVHDAAALPANGAVPKISIPVSATVGASLDFATHGRTFDVGIVVCNSTTGATLTVGAANCLFDAQYI